MRKRCCSCNKLSANWNRVNGYTFCYDGCFSTLGFDHRTKNGTPAWLPDGKLLAWDPARMASSYRGVFELAYISSASQK